MGPIGFGFGRKIGGVESAKRNTHQASFGGRPQAPMFGFREGNKFGLEKP